MAVIRQADVEAIFTVTDRLGVSREAVVIPLTKCDPGGVRVLPDQRLEIVVPASGSVDEWLPALEREVQALAGSERED